MINVQDILRAIKPYVVGWISVVGGGGGPFAPSPHDLSSAHHAGSIADSQAPQFLKTDGSRQLTGNMSVGAGVTIDGVDISALAGVPFVTVSLSSAVSNERAAAGGDGITISDGGAGGSLSWAVNATVARNTWPINAGSGLTGGGNLSSSGITLNVGAGNGITVGADTVGLTTPGSLSVSSANNPAGNHTHAVASSSNPGAAVSLLASDANGYSQLVRLGAGVAPSYALHARSTNEQLRLEFDVDNYASFIVGGGGNLTVAPTGDFIFDPTGDDILPATGYDLNIGSLAKKYLTLHAAELWVETLVAQNTLATIGGRILVGPTTTLTADLLSSEVSPVTLSVKHNDLANGDVVLMEADGKVEFFKIVSAASGSGPYTYSATRDLDGSGANDWYAGDAVFSTGQTGDGFIDLYSVRGVKESSDIGPSIVGNVRNSDTYNDWSEHWAIGNLNGLYGYGVDTFGVAVGKYGASTSWLSADATNGIRIMRGDTALGQWQVDGDFLIGTNISSPTTTNIAIFNAAQTYNSEAVGAGDLLLGDNSSSKANVLWDKSTGQLKFRGGTTTQAYIDTTGAITFGGGSGLLDSNGLRFAPGTGNPNKIRWNAASFDYAEMYANTSGNNSFFTLKLNQNAGTGGAATITFEAQSYAEAPSDYYWSRVVQESSTWKWRVSTNGGAFSDKFTLDKDGNAAVAAGGSYKTNLHRVYSKTFTLANNGTALLPLSSGDPADAWGMIMVFNVTEGNMALYAMNGGNHTTHELADPVGAYSATAGTGSSINIYWSAGNSRYEIQNTRGSSRTIDVLFFAHA